MLITACESGLIHLQSHDTQCCLLSSACLCSTLGHGLMRKPTCVSVCVSVSGCLSSAYQTGSNCFLSLTVTPAGQTMLPWSPGRSLNKQETYKWPQSHRQTPLPDPTQTDHPTSTQPPPPKATHTHTDTQTTSRPCVFLAPQLSIPCSYWPDSCSLTTPPRPDRLAAVPFPGWPRARHSGRRSPRVSLDQLCSRLRGLRVPAPPCAKRPLCLQACSNVSTEG